MMLPSALTHDNARETAQVLEGLLVEASGSLSVDLSAVEAVDSAGVAVLAAFVRNARARDIDVHFSEIRDEVAATLALFPFPDGEAPVPREGDPLLLRWGSAAETGADVLLAYTMLCADVAWFTVTGVFKRRGIRWSEVANQMAQMGSRAFGVVGLIAFLVGGTLALQSAEQLRNFGANIFVVDLVGLSVTRELGPLITAIVVAGRSGSAVAAEIGTMRITEELDALRTMGIHPIRFLIVPKVIAITLTQPLLTTFASALAIGGGFLVGVTYLEIGPTSFLERLQETLQVRDVVTGLIKSVAFANIIVTIGTLCGLRTSGGADAVGQTTTLSVVASIFAVIVADALFSLVFYF